VLSASGVAPPSWIVLASRLAPLIPGVSRFDASSAADATLRAAVAEIEGLSPLFTKGQAELARGQEEVLRHLVARMAEMVGVAASVGRRFRVEVIGHTDADGRPEANLPLSRARAAVVRSALQPVAANRLEFVDVGVGSDDPVARSDSEPDKQRNRRVSVRVTPLSESSRTGHARP